MKTIRSLVLVATIVFVAWIAACNYTVGECWPVGQGGGRDGDSVVAGGGVILPTGPTGGGGYGDEPPNGPQGGTESTLKCNSDDEDETESPTGSPTESPAENKCSAGEAGSLTVCSDGCTGPCGVSGGPFAPDIFKFVTIVPDDGKGEAGGWQEAVAKLRIVRYYPIIIEYWYCPITIKMPIRTVMNGEISPEYAALLSAQIANQAANKVRAEDIIHSYPQGIFCVRIKTEMISIASKAPYNSFGISIK